MTKLNWEAVLDQIDDAYVLEAAETGERRASAKRKRVGRPTRRLAALAAAAALLLALGVTAYAISSIHQRRQAELKESLSIEDNQVESYVEYDTGAEENRLGIMLLSAVADGEFQRVYVNVSPVSREDVSACAGTAKFAFSVDGGNTFSYAAPYMPQEERLKLNGSDLVTAYDPDTGGEIRYVDPAAVSELMLEHAYDQETQTLTLQCNILRSEMDCTKPVELEVWGITMRPGDDGSVEVSFDRNFGSVSFDPTGLEVRELMLDTPVVFENSETGQCGTIEGLIVYPTELTWLVTHPDAENVYRGDWTEEEKAEYRPLQVSWLNSIEEALSGAKLNFTDGTSFAIPVIVRMPFEDGWAKGVTYWTAAININAIESVEIMGQTVGIRQG